MRNKKIKIFYREEMAYIGVGNFSKSPGKPKLFVEHMKKKGLYRQMFDDTTTFYAFDKEVFKTVHNAKYVDDFFSGKKPLADSNGLKWNSAFADTVRYTNSSLLSAIEKSILNPKSITFSPTSGFHHAHPDSGSGFCTFAGQVIASLHVYESLGAVGCYFDLDGHFGNSIEDCRKSKRLKSKLNKAIPTWANVNPKYHGEAYVNDFEDRLNFIKHKILLGEIDYVVWCHGADSHEDDLLHGQVNTRQWTKCTRLFCEMIKSVDKERGKPIPVSIALFGGYRKKYNEVLELHEKDLTIIHKQLCNGY